MKLCNINLLQGEGLIIRAEDSRYPRLIGLAMATSNIEEKLRMCTTRQIEMDYLSQDGTIHLEESADNAIALAKLIRENGLQNRISIKPETPNFDIAGVLETGLLDIVDILAVNPGFGRGNHTRNLL